MGTIACGSAQPARAAEGAAPDVPTLRQGPLTEYVPAPTLRWLILAQPEHIAAAPGVLEALAPLVDDEAWRRFTQRNGFDLRRTPALLAAGFELGTLYLIDPPGPAKAGRGRAIEDRFRERLLRGEVVAQPHPALTRVQGVASATPQALLRVEGGFVAHADGDPSLIRIVEGFLLGRFTKTPTALNGATLRAHATFAEQAPLRSWIPDPLDHVSAFPDSESLRGATAAVAAAEFFEHRPCPCQGEHPGKTAGAALRLHLGLAGPWDPSAVSPAPLEDIWRALTQSASGRLLHLDVPLRPLQSRVVSTEDGARLELVVELALAPLLRGLQGIISGELPELFSFQQAAPPGNGAPAEGPADDSSYAAFRRPGKAVD